MKTGRLLIFMLTALILCACNKPSDRTEDSVMQSESTYRSTEANEWTNISEDKETSGSDDSEIEDFIESGDVIEGSLSVSGLPEEDSDTKEQKEGLSSIKDTTEVSLEGNVVSSNSKPDDIIQDPDDSNGNSVKTTEEPNETCTVTSTSVAEVSTVERTSQAVIQTSTAVESDPSEAVTQIQTVPQPVTAEKPVYNPDYVIAEAVKRLKASGYIYLPDKLDASLAAGKITKEEYDAWYPTNGAGYFDYTCWNEDMEYNIYELVEAQIFIDYFYIEYLGTDKWGGHIYRCYR